MAPPLKGFMIPSLFGDEPALADLRREVRTAIRLDVVTLPDAQARGRLLTDMAATGRYVTEQILARQPKGHVAVVGFSFGASLALEVAVQLEQAGRQVSFLGILDGPFEPPELHRPQVATPRFAKLRQRGKAWAVKVIERFVFVRRFVVTRSAPDLHKISRQEGMRRAVLWHLRSKALSAWTPTGCAAPGLHISTGDYGFDNRARWAALCPNLRHAEIRVIHEDLIKRGSRKAVSALLRQAVEACSISDPRRMAAPS